MDHQIQTQTSSASPVRVRLSLEQSTLEILFCTASVLLHDSMASDGRWSSQSQLVDKMSTHQGQINLLALRRLRLISWVKLDKQRALAALTSTASGKSAPILSACALRHTDWKTGFRACAFHTRRLGSQTLKIQATDESLTAADVLETVERIGWPIHWAGLPQIAKHGLLSSVARTRQN